MGKSYIILLRISIGFIFLWAFFDKLLGLGFATPPERAWILGFSPTFGYLKNATYGPFADFFQSLAGNPIVDFLFMLGLLSVGIAFVLGIALRSASYAGATMLILMFLSTFPPKNNPIIDDHIIYAVLMLLIGTTESKSSISKWWSKTSIAKTFSFLR
ncbi:MAG: hypothetical protein A2868_02695 [Candidatus Levybacteria bacterium RIFCSPHIGHO2_01_FULL_40_15b]|nr:MAG: hypothetical protein A2868_02695 [Candidatus Levybacteria bacterium RIFCSPHIGHO2_01_FULL_40_15b]